MDFTLRKLAEKIIFYESNSKNTQYRSGIETINKSNSD